MAIESLVFNVDNCYELVKNTPQQFIRNLTDYEKTHLIFCLFLKIKEIYVDQKEDIKRSYIAGWTQAVNAMQTLEEEEYDGTYINLKIDPSIEFEKWMSKKRCGTCKYFYPGNEYRIDKCINQKFIDFFNSNGSLPPITENSACEFWERKNE
jgi:hypothetical protein